MAGGKTFKERFLDCVWKVLQRILPDKPYLSLKYRVVFKKKLNWDNPKTFNEKLQWLKLYGPGREYTPYVDKLAVKKIVADLIGEEYIIPALGVWDRAEDIDFEQLPNQFVLKCNHDSGGVLVCRDKAGLDCKAARDKMQESLDNNYYLMGREMPYKFIRRKIFAEQYMHDDATEDIRDYKFFCFDGEPKAMFIASDRAKDVKFDFFDNDFNHLALRQGYDNASAEPARPENFELMKTLTSRLAAGFPHVRVDFYEVNGRVYFGEMTFFHFSGFMPFEPSPWDDIFGSWLTLPSK